jgi:hypothetical protein
MFIKKQETQVLKNKLEETLMDNADSKFQTLTLDDMKVELVYIKSLSDPKKVQELVVKSFFELESLEKFESYMESLDGYVEYKDEEEAVESVFKGNVVILTPTRALIVDLMNYVNQGILEASTETTIQGPQTALSENVQLNLNLIRHRYHKKSLITEKLQPIGNISKMDTFLVYDKEMVSEELLQKVREKLDSIKMDIVQAPGSIRRGMMKEKALFPTFITTERPDRIAYNLSKGKVVLLMEGTPFAMIIPAVFFDFMSSMEDFYQTYWVSKFIITLRYIGLLVSVSLPALYVAITAFTPELFRVQLALSIAGSRIGVPYPAYLEVLFMLLIMEMLIEASIRLPKTIGGTATTVGGLILGQASTEAGLVSTLMIIIVASVAISNFVIPINEMGFAMRVVKYILLLLGTIFGTVGLIVSLLGFLLYLVHLDSFGEPFLRVTGSEKTSKT